MNESKINRDNYIIICGWMVTELGLKGNELITYAMIYGFSQVENQTFDGSINYLSEWLSASRPTVVSTLKSLVDKGLIEKKESLIKNVKICKYRAVKAAPALIAPQPPAEKADTLIYKQIVDYLNMKTGRKFNHQNRETRRHIHARLVEGRQLDDFKRVIDIKCAEWQGSKMSIYLRPSTLFGSNFESYVNQEPNLLKKELNVPSDNPAKSFNIDDVM